MLHPIDLACCISILICLEICFYLLFVFFNPISYLVVYCLGFTSRCLAKVITNCLFQIMSIIYQSVGDSPHFHFQEMENLKLFKGHFYCCCLLLSEIRYFINLKMLYACYAFIHYLFIGFFKASFVLDGRGIVVNQIGRCDPSTLGT